MKTQITKCEAKASPVGASLTLYGDIGASIFGDSISAEQVKAQLEQCRGPLAVYINSAGGNVFEGVAIYNQLKRYPDPVTCYVDGVAASIASVIAMAGSKLVMSKASMLMIHEAHAGIVGNAGDLEKAAADLRKITDMIRGVYVAKTGLPEAEVAEMMAAETWLGAGDCVEKGFANEVLAEEEPIARATAQATQLDTYRNTPPKLRTAPHDIAVARMQMSILVNSLSRSPSGNDSARPAGDKLDAK